MSPVRLCGGKKKGGFELRDRSRRAPPHGGCQRQREQIRGLSSRCAPPGRRQLVIKRGSSSSQSLPASRPCLCASASVHVASTWRIFLRSAAGRPPFLGLFGCLLAAYLSSQ